MCVSSSSLLAPEFHSAGLEVIATAFHSFQLPPVDAELLLLLLLLLLLPPLLVLQKGRNRLEYSISPPLPPVAASSSDQPSELQRGLRGVSLLQ